jgi:hypothetical protein
MRTFALINKIIRSTSVLLYRLHVNNQHDISFECFRIRQCKMQSTIWWIHNSHESTYSSTHKETVFTVYTGGWRTGDRIENPCPDFVSLVPKTPIRQYMATTTTQPTASAYVYTITQYECQPPRNQKFQHPVFSSIQIPWFQIQFVQNK